MFSFSLGSSSSAVCSPSPPVRMASSEAVFAENYTGFQIRQGKRSSKTAAEKTSTAERLRISARFLFTTCPSRIILV